MQRPDLIGRLDNARDQTAQHLEAARQMQIGLLPTPDQLSRLCADLGVGVAALYRSGEAVGGDFWGLWPTGRGRFALAIADFAGHGLSAALNTFRLHALLSEQTLPRGQPTRMTALLNQRLHELLPRGQYATMVYLHIDPGTRSAVWCSAGGPPPMFVSAAHSHDLAGRGLPLGVRAGAVYRRQWMRFPGPGLLTVFSDGLFESGSHDPDVARTDIADALAEPARLAAGGSLMAAARDGVDRLEALRDRHPCPGYSDDIMAICIAFGCAAEPENAGGGHSEPPS
jgi:sigma-B regulation protein RsbU (phosphoserine phosphatase)